MIYVVHILNHRYMKIGYAKSVSARIKSLQCGNPFEIKELFVIEGTLRQEKTIHSSLSSAFEALSLKMPKNEWYPGKYHFFKNFLKELKYSANHGIAFSESFSSSLFTQKEILIRKNRTKKRAYIKQKIKEFMEANPNADNRQIGEIASISRKEWIANNSQKIEMMENMGDGDIIPVVEWPNKPPRNKIVIESLY